MAKFENVSGQTMDPKLVATPTSDGLMSAADKAKLDTISEGAGGYVHPATHPATMITQDSTHRFVTDTEKSTWNAKASTAVANVSSNGLMSSADKVKLDGIATGANRTTVDSSLSSTSTNPVQNKVINTALAGKAASSHTHTKSQITDFPSSLPANGGNADTVDGKHATDFATSGHTHTTLMATDITGQTKSLDSFTLNTGTPKIAYYVCMTDGGGENITGRPDDANKRAFMLEVQSIRYTNSSDYITKQTYTIGSLKLSYVRYCTNGTWSTWERMYTSVQKPTPSEIGAAASSHTHTGSQITQDSTHRFVSDAEKSTWNGKASTAVATTSANGLMSKNDKTKLDGIATGANKYVHPTGAGNNHIPSGGSAGQFLKWSASGTAVWAADNNTTYSPATTSANGLMSSTDKVKLDGIATGANKTVVDSALSSSSTNPVQNKVINSALAGKAATSHGKHVPTVCDTITDWNSVTTNGWYMASGGKNAPTSADWYMGYVITHNTNYVIQELYKFTESTDAYVVSKYLRVRMNGTWGSWREVTVGAQVPTNAKFTDTVYTHPSSHPATMITADSTHRFVTDSQISTWNAKASTSVATQSANGLMSATDKKKLDGIASGANKYTHPSSHAATMITQDSTHRFVTDTEKSTWNGKATVRYGTSVPSNSLGANGDIYIMISSGTYESQITTLTNWKSDVLAGKTAIPVKV